MAIHNVPSPADKVLLAGRNLVLSGKTFSLVEHKGAITLNSDGFATGGGVRQNYGPHSLISLQDGQSIQLRRGVNTRTSQRHAKHIGITLAVGVCFAGFAALAAVLWYTNRLLSPYGWGGYGLDGWGGFGPCGYW